MAVELTAAALEALIRERPADVDAALQQVSPVGTRLGIVEMAAFLGVAADKDPATFATRALAYLTAVNLLDEFAALVAGEQTAEDLAAELAAMQIDPAIGERLFRRTIHARCAIYRDGDFRGSGCLVGPSLVLTCAHVLDPPTAERTYPGVEVELGNTVRVRAEPRPAQMSPVAPADKELPLARIDDLFDDCHDYALLRLQVPVGANCAVVDCPQCDWKPSRRAPLFLLHYPQGQDQGVGLGQLASYSRPRLRWGYLARGAKPGSSGGACFNAKGELIGIHQGKLANGSRLVPLMLFRSAIAGEIANDLWPDYLWSPEGRLDGTLVIGRGDLFRAFALMARADSAFRLLRIKRLDPTAGTGGLGYSVRLVRQLVDRQPKGHRAISLSWPQALYDKFDPIDELVRLAAAEQLLEPAAQAPPSAPASGDARQMQVRVEAILRALHIKLTERGETLWVIVEHAAVNLGDRIVALELLASQVPHWPSLRLALVGNESLSLPEPEFRVDDVARSELPGVALVEYLGPVTRRDVEEFIVGMHTAIIGEPPLAKQLAAWTDAALANVPQVLNAYPPETLPTITATLRDILRPLQPAEPKAHGQ